MRTVLRQLIDRISSVTENPFAAVDIRNRAPGRWRCWYTRDRTSSSEVVVVNLDLPEVHGPDHITIKNVDFVVPTGSVVTDGEGLSRPHSRSLT